MRPFAGRVHIVGCGGVGSWMAPSMCLLVKPEQVILYDGDKLELKNMNRQLFTLQDIGRNKAESLAERYGCQFRPSYFSQGQFQIDEEDVIICCADNNPARLACIREANSKTADVIVAANELTSAEAYYWGDCFWDLVVPNPLEYYPEIVNDHTQDPRAAAIGCTGDAQAERPQLVSANFMAASLAQWLFVCWEMETVGIDNALILNKLPYKLVSNMAKLETYRIADYWKEQKAKKGQKTT